MDIHVRRIKSKFEEIFGKKIDMSDSHTLTSECFENKKMSRALAAYALIMECGIDADMAAASVTDGFQDNGLDAIYKDEIGKKLVFIQSKWSNNGDQSITLGDTLKFTQGVEQLLSFDFSNCNEKIKHKKKDIESSINGFDYKIHLIITYTSNQPLPKESENAITKLKSQINDDVTTLITSKVLNKQNIISGLTNSIGANDINIEDLILQNWGSTTSSEGTKGYYGVVSANTVAEWWTTHGNAIFAKNIRYFKGNTEVNTGIENSLSYEPEKFFYYNNGIKILAKSVDRKVAHSADKEVGLFKLSGISVVNGAQTVGSIGNVYSKNPEQVSKAKVFVQIIALENTDEQFSYMITKLSNTQNRIEHKSFASLDPIQEKIRTELLLDRFDYSYKDGEVAKGENIITMDDIAVSVGCCIDDVNISTIIKGSYGTIYENIEKTPYKLIFNSSLNAYHIINCVKIFRKFEIDNSAYKNSNDGINRLISIHGNRFLLHLIFKSFRKSGYSIGEQYYDFDNCSIDKLIKQYVEKIINIKNEHYRDAYPANMFKNAKRCRMIAEKVEILLFDSL